MNLKEALFCDICREIQSSEYGIIDITSLNPNVLVELGIMLALGKPISVLFKKNAEANLRHRLPKDIIWKRVIPYEEFIDISEQLKKQITNYPKSHVSRSIDELKNELNDQALENMLEKKLNTILEAAQKEFAKLMEEAKIDGVIPSKKINVDVTTEAKLECFSSAR